MKKLLKSGLALVCVFGISSVFAADGSSPVTGAVSIDANNFTPAFVFNTSDDVYIRWASDNDMIGVVAAAGRGTGISYGASTNGGKNISCGTDGTTLSVTSAGVVDALPDPDAASGCP